MNPPPRAPRPNVRAGRSSRNAARAREAAERHFGHRSLLPGQEETMSALLDGYDVLLVSPTGSGKSLTYQVAGVLLQGCTLVVSPLLALQQDQIDGLLEGGPELRAARISSAETEAQREDALARARNGELEFLFMSPEQLANPDVLRAVAETRPSLVAVDEAHCVSAWGHDFRPDYFRLGELIEQIGAPRTIAMTATAALPVREDIVEQLGLRDHRMIVTGFERDNIGLRVVRCSDPDDQRRTVLAVVQELAAEQGGSGIVYCRTRRGAEECAAALAELGRRTTVYHAGLSQKARNEAFNAFMDDEVEIVVATSAFGMGIDKPDIRYVVHAEVPESPDTYYQEVGRAGRDGAPATATLVYRPEDLSLGRFFSSGIPKREDVRAVLAAVAETGDTDPRQVQAASGFGARKAGRILNLIELVEESGGARPGAGPAEPGEAAGEAAGEAGVEAVVEAVLETAEAHRRLEHSRVEMMRGYAETARCRSDFLLAYFGEEADDLCGICDNCVDGVATEVATDEGSAFPLRSLVHHAEFGAGTVTDLEEDRITVLFDEVGYRTLSLRLVEERDLLRKAEGGAA
ncbi:MAG TPA: RecQ family ATP-dependent DNA helicase [Nocardioidaceae bacterium]